MNKLVDWLVVRPKCAQPRKSPKILSRLNDLRDGRKNICLVSGALRRISKFLRITFLIAWFCGRMVGEGE